MQPSSPTVLLTGATGFVGSHLRPALVQGGATVRSATRDAAGARAEEPDAEWVEVDLESGDGLDAALEGCDVAYYLYHAMAGGRGYAERERRAAEGFRDAAARAGLGRIVYLGGVEPAGRPSKHLRSRLETGELLRAGAVDTVELRAAMVVGEGSVSWHIVRDLASRLPAMALPSWLRNRSMPILVDDLVLALLHAAAFETDGSAVLDAPGADVISHRDLLKTVARRLGHDPPMVDVPFQVPALSSLWVGLVSDADFEVVKELVEGLDSDLLPTRPVVWERIAGDGPTSIERAVELVLGDAEAGEPPSDRVIRRILERTAGVTL